MTTVFLHGLGQAPESWDAVLNALGLSDCRCPSLPGLVSGQKPTYQNLYAAFSAYCDEIPGKLRLCGLSLGAVLALHYATEHPGKLTSLVLIGAQYKMPKALLTLQNLIFRFMPQGSFRDIGFGKQDFITLCGSTKGLDFSKALVTISCPTLVLCGENDKANKDAAVEISQGIPGSRLLLIPQAGHQVNMDQPKALAEAIRDFWKDAT